MGKNTGTVQGIYAAFGRGDVPAILAQLADDVSWEHGAPDHGVPWLRPGTGVAHVGQFFASLAALEFTKFEVTSVLDGGDVVVALINLAATVRETGRSLDSVEEHGWRFEPDGKVASFNHLVDTHQHVLAYAGKG